VIRAGQIEARMEFLRSTTGRRKGRQQIGSTYTTAPHLDSTELVLARGNLPVLRQTGHYFRVARHP